MARKFFKPRGYLYANEHLSPIAPIHGIQSTDHYKPCFILLNTKSSSFACKLFIHTVSIVLLFPLNGILLELLTDNAELFCLRTCNTIDSIVEYKFIDCIIGSTGVFWVGMTSSMPPSSWIPVASTDYTTYSKYIN